MSSFEKKLDFWIQNNYNVLFKGKAGVGKSALVIDAFNKAGLKWLYFSASTMDPWVDFIGVPKEVKNEQGQSYLDLIRPKYFQNDEIEALFLDEFNRSSKKIRNAVMELIQFKSINGKKFSKIKIIWAAINPNDEDQKYDVEELDPAQKDRFHVHIDIPYVPSSAYFNAKYGKQLADSSLTWWKELDDKIKNEISPRRLDYALDMYTKGGDIRDVLPSNANVNKLLLEIKNGNFTKQLEQLFKLKAAEEAKNFLQEENQYTACIDLIIGKQKYLEFFLPLLSDEKLASLIVKNMVVENFVLNHIASFENILNDIGKSNLNKSVSRRIRDAICAFNAKKAVTTGFQQSNILKRHFNSNISFSDFKANLALTKSNLNTQQRIRNYHILNDYIIEFIPVVEANNILNLLLEIFNSSHKATIKNKLPNLIPMINHVTYLLLSQEIKVHMGAKELKELTEFPDFIYNVKYELPFKS